MYVKFADSPAKVTFVPDAEIRATESSAFAKFARKRASLPDHADVRAVSYISQSPVADAAFIIAN